MPQLPDRPIYDINRTWEENGQEGPFFSKEIPERAPCKPECSFLGLPVASRIGVAAGPLLNSRWTSLAADLGFDIITYKTIRSRAHPCHPLPNVIFVDTPEPLHPSPKPTLVQREHSPQTMKDIAITNSFGMPSRGPNFLFYDIHRARTLLKKNQVLVVSIVGSGSDKDELTADFVQAAKLAAKGGAQVIEVNFSCPNVTSGQGSLYLDAQMVAHIGRAVVDAARLPIVMKVGTFPDTITLSQTLSAAVDAGLQGVCGINSVMGEVFTADGAPALGKERITSGICGAPILDAASAFLREAREVIDRKNLPLTLMGVGGVTEAHDFDTLLSNGADFALTATGMMWNPMLAQQYHELQLVEAPL